ncbi:hypothetical protein BGZ63DRAFT_450052 [Mariannaea sp. PMI_226]|nr:hypothetical protein BGZ63DRAFT_450052 [Mariannaea sp. PMI_226]
MKVSTVLFTLFAAAMAAPAPAAAPADLKERGMEKRGCQPGSYCQDHYCWISPTCPAGWCVLMNTWLPSNQNTQIAKYLGSG